jgi:hypothetical protein
LSERTSKNLNENLIKNFKHSVKSSSNQSSRVKSPIRFPSASCDYEKLETDLAKINSKKYASKDHDQKRTVRANKYYIHFPTSSSSTLANYSNLIHSSLSNVSNEYDEQNTNELLSDSELSLSTVMLNSFTIS